MNNQNTPLNSNTQSFHPKPIFNPLMMYPQVQPVNYITNFNFHFNGNRVDEKDISVKVENGEHRFNVRDSYRQYNNRQYNNRHYNNRHYNESINQNNVHPKNQNGHPKNQNGNSKDINKLEELIINELLNTFNKPSIRPNSDNKPPLNKPNITPDRPVIPPFDKPNIRVIPINSMGGSLDELFSGMFKQKDNKLKVLDAPILAENNFDVNKDYDKLPFEVKDLDTLITLADLYDKNNPHQFGINMKRLHLIKSSLENLKNIIGMENVKKKIFEKIISFLQGLGNVDDMNHIMIVGPPGHGKTKLAFHLSEIFYKMGIIKKIEEGEEKKEYYHPFTNEKIDFPFIIARRKDLVGEYVGHTSPKVTNMVKKALGGVLFIDEAYDIGKKDNTRDSFSEEAINALNQAMSEYGGQFILMIAGYKEMIKEQFMINPGMERRFRMIFEIEKYKTEELTDILDQMINKAKYNKDKDLSKQNLVEFIKDNEKHFKYSGGDLEILLQNTIEQHSIRVLGNHPKDKRYLTLEDFKNGIKEFIKNRNNKSIPDVYRHMFV
jgi:stage V sporulation protein K